MSYNKSSILRELVEETYPNVVKINIDVMRYVMEKVKAGDMRPPSKIAREEIPARIFQLPISRRLTEQLPEAYVRRILLTMVHFVWGLLSRITAGEEIEIEDGIELFLNQAPPPPSN